MARPIRDLPRPRREKKLPSVLSRAEVARLLTAVTNLKHRAVLMLAYSSGLRVSEVVRLKVGDIDQDRKLVHVRQAKGRKDRYTLLSDVALEVLGRYRSTRRHSCGSVSKQKLFWVFWLCANRGKPS